MPPCATPSQPPCLNRGRSGGVEVVHAAEAAHVEEIPDRAAGRDEVPIDGDRGHLGGRGCEGPRWGPSQRVLQGWFGDLTLGAWSSEAFGIP